MAERAIFLFDGPNIYKNLKLCGLNKGRLNYRKLAENLADSCELTEVLFFTSASDSATDYDNHVAQQRFFAALHASGVGLRLGRLVHRASVCPECGHRNNFKIEKSVDVQIAMELALGAAEDRWDTAYLASCDADLIPAVTFARSRGKNVLLLLPIDAPCHGVGNACTAVIPLTQECIDEAQAPERPFPPVGRPCQILDPQPDQPALDEDA